MSYVQQRNDPAPLPGERRRRCQCTTARATTCRLWSVASCGYQVSGGKVCGMALCRVHQADDPAGPRCKAHARLQGGLFTGLL